MKLRATAFVLILTTAVQASQNLDVFVCDSGTVPLQVLAPAESLAARILASADVVVVWHEPVHSTQNSLNRRIVLDFRGTAPATNSNRALGYALVQEGVHASIFYDRIRQIAAENQHRYILAHAMAHEIAHLLQGDGHHSATGVMKAHWSQRDLFEMRHPMSFTPEDIRLIRHMSEPSSLSGSVMY
jgi:hypothetical protein